MNIKKTIILFLTPLFLLTSCGPNPEHYDKVILSGKIPGIGELNEITLGKELQNRVEKLYRDCRRNIHKKNMSLYAGNPTQYFDLSLKSEIIDNSISIGINKELKVSRINWIVCPNKLSFGTPYQLSGDIPKEIFTQAVYLVDAFLSLYNLTIDDLSF